MKLNLFGESDDLYKFKLSNFTTEAYEGNYTCEILLPNRQKIRSSSITIKKIDTSNFFLLLQNYKKKDNHNFIDNNEIARNSEKLGLIQMLISVSIVAGLTIIPLVVLYVWKRK